MQSESDGLQVNEELEFQEHHHFLYNELQRLNQSHLISAWARLPQEGRDKFVNDLFGDFCDLLEKIRDCCARSEPSRENETNLLSFERTLLGPDLVVEPSAASNKAQLFVTDGWEQAWFRSYNERGHNLLCEGKLAVVIMTRTPEPEILIAETKLQSRKSVLQLFMERLRRLQHLVRRKNPEAPQMPVFIVVPGEFQLTLERHLKIVDYYHWGEEVQVVPQARLPCVDRLGRVLLNDDSSRILSSAGGDGDALNALQQNGVLVNLRDQGCEYLEFVSAENLLTRPADPFFLGFTKNSMGEITCKCAHRQQQNTIWPLFVSHAQEKGELRRDMTDIQNKKIGARHGEVFEMGKIGGREDKMTADQASAAKSAAIKAEQNLLNRKLSCAILPSNHTEGFLAKKNAETGAFEHRATIIGTYHLHLELVDYILRPETSEALKKCSLGLPVLTRESSAVHELAVESQSTDVTLKFERRLLNYFMAAGSCAGLLVDQKYEFAPISGFDGLGAAGGSLSSVANLSRAHQLWIEESGGVFRDGVHSGEDPELLCEISPLVSYAGEDLRGVFPPGYIEVDLPLYVPCAGSPRPNERKQTWADREMQMYGELQTIQFRNISRSKLFELNDI